MTTTGRPPRPDAPAIGGLPGLSPLRDLLDSMLGLLLGEISDGTRTERLHRFVDPLNRCRQLERDLADRTYEAREAVARVEAHQMSDLATGVIMARTGCDVATARSILHDWLDGRGLDPKALTPTEVATLLTEPVGDPASS